MLQGLTVFGPHLDVKLELLSRLNLYVRIILGMGFCTILPAGHASHAEKYSTFAVSSLGMLANIFWLTILHMRLQDGWFHAS